ncbi:MAG: hypothetical protein H7Y88_08400 [Phycisphaerales bacterium]|nr:hypothetical protein [Phycisphaerales bacterium]
MAVCTDSEVAAARDRTRAVLQQAIARLAEEASARQAARPLANVVRNN